MHLTVDFSSLERAASRFQSRREFKLKVDDTPPLERIDLDLQTGIDITGADLDFEDGLLAYKGRHVILYIRDHGTNVEEAIRNPGVSGKRFHVADCRTLRKMREEGRFDRYVVTQSTSGRFDISGLTYPGKKLVSGSAELHVCMNCLDKLNYDAYSLASSNERRIKRETFDLLAFFETYSTRFTSLPRALADRESASGYSADWAEISRRLRQEASYCCLRCRVQLREHLSLLHVHHVNGVKNDNRDENLEVLCKDCHRKQPKHGHIFLSAKEMRTISSLRREQGIRGESWEAALRLADLAARPALTMAQHRRWEVPQVGVDLQGPQGERIHLDAAWFDQRRGVSADKAAVLPEGWRISGSADLLEELSAR